MILNAPDNLIGKAFCKIIARAEVKKHDENNRRVNISDIVEAISEIRVNTTQNIGIEISGLSIDCFNKDSIKHIYRFPVDKSYMIILKDKPDVIIFTAEFSCNKKNKNSKENNNAGICL